MRTSKLADEAGIGWLRAGSDSGAGQASLPDTAMTSLPVLTRACRWTPVESVGYHAPSSGARMRRRGLRGGLDRHEDLLSVEVYPTSPVARVSTADGTED